MAKRMQPNLPNTTDIGMWRERVAEFLTVCPSVNLFGNMCSSDDGWNRSNRWIVTTDTAPGSIFIIPTARKAFSPREGTLPCFIKSVRRKGCTRRNRVHPQLPHEPGSSASQNQNYDDWPYKVVYATPFHFPTPAPLLISSNSNVGLISLSGQIPPDPRSGELCIFARRFGKHGDVPNGRTKAGAGSYHQ